MSTPLTSHLPCEETLEKESKIPKNAWNPVSSNNTGLVKSFEELMSEDMAKDLQEREEKEYLELIEQTKNPNSPLFKLNAASDTSSDFLLALSLQQQYDKQHNDQIQREEKFYNKNSKLSLSFSKYKVSPEYEDSDSDEDLLYLDDDNRALDKFEESSRSDPVIPPCGYIKHNNKMVTKHDTELSGRKNAEKVMNFPPGFNTGDGGGFDMQISNKVYNKLAKSALAESKRKQRVRDKVDKATAEKALDPKTRLIIYKMVNNSILESVNGVVSTGKESVVFHASGGIYESLELPSECALKVFKTTLTDFKTREKYIKDDYRFKDRMSKNNNRMMIQMWAEKEYHNLKRLQKAGIPSPTPILVRKHALVMSFIGDGQVPAPKLKHVSLSYEEWESAWAQIVQIMSAIFRECRLVHGDLSEYNILYFEGQCWIIDLGQAIEPVHPNALTFLYRDCCNISRFFKCKGLSDVLSPLNLFRKVSGIEVPGAEEDAERLIAEYEVQQELWREGATNGSSENFDFVWEEIQKDQSRHIACLSESDFEDDVTTDDLDAQKVTPTLDSTADDKEENLTEVGKSSCKKKKNKSIKKKLKNPEVTLSAGTNASGCTSASCEES